MHMVLLIYQKIFDFSEYIFFYNKNLNNFEKEIKRL